MRPPCHTELDRSPSQHEQPMTNPYTRTDPLTATIAATGMSHPDSLTVTAHGQTFAVNRQTCAVNRH